MSISTHDVDYLNTPVEDLVDLWISEDPDLLLHTTRAGVRELVLRVIAIKKEESS